MPSKAFAAFHASKRDVLDLLKLHISAGGAGPGRRRGLEALNKGGVVLISAIWESYCEDLCLEALALVLDNTHPLQLPKELRKLVAAALKTDRNELAIWRLAAGGWKQESGSIVRRTIVAPLNTPKTRQIDDLFRRALDLPRLSSRWTWTKMKADRASQILDKYVELRGDVAHGRSWKPVRKSQVTGFLQHVDKIVLATDRVVEVFLRNWMGKAPW